ncbi:MAG: hypothetical protein AAGI01_07115 [Myxococcota bacterium]
MGQQMSAREIERLLADINLSDEEIASRFGVDPGDVSTWRRDGVGGVVAYALRQLASEHAQGGRSWQRVHALSQLSADSSSAIEEFKLADEVIASFSVRRVTVELRADDTCAVEENGQRTIYSSPRKAMAVWSEWASYTPREAEPILTEEKEILLIAVDVVCALELLIKCAGIGELSSVNSESHLKERVSTRKLALGKRRARLELLARMRERED